MNILFRTPDGALFETLQAARAHGSGAAHIAAQTWCSDCGEWVPAGPYCGLCGAPPYDEDGYTGFQGGMGRSRWAMYQAERRKLAAWNAGLPIRPSEQLD
jgi:hypothetical protein